MDRCVDLIWCQSNKSSESNNELITRKEQTGARQKKIGEIRFFCSVVCAKSIAAPLDELIELEATLHRIAPSARLYRSERQGRRRRFDLFEAYIRPAT
jgi:hypothetical protein